MATMLGSISSISSISSIGSVIAEAMEPNERRQFGAHYTSEADIMKVLRSLFLDELEDQLSRAQRLQGTARRCALADFHDRLTALCLLDPACGCGDFLLVAYRELRRLELEALLSLPAGAAPNKVSIKQFYGIELLQVPAKIARMSMGLLEQHMDHQLAEALGRPLPHPAQIQAPHIRCANALRIDWNELLPAAECSYVLGNPPFIGKQARTPAQVEDMQIVFGDTKSIHALDYVCAWYKKAADYINGTKVEVAYVSTNSITQGEQPGVLWPLLYRGGAIEIVFAHRTFPWRSSARDQAHVHVVIIGFSAGTRRQRRIYAEAGARAVESISPYLVEGARETLSKRRDPLDPTTPRASFGNMPNDGGHLLLSEAERLELLRADPDAAAFIRPFVSAKQFLAGDPRWCLWLPDASPAQLQRSKPITQKLAQVQSHRQRSTRAATRELADTPTTFGEIRQPTTTYVLIPRHPSARRSVVPLGYFTPDHIIADSCIAVPGASKYHFGVLSSTMHDAWLRQVGGRIRSDLRYSIELVYNNFPWPPAPTPAQRDAVERAADGIIELRQAHPGSSLADLYAQSSMPSELARAHAKLDAAVDDCYAIDNPLTPSERVALLFTLWRKRTD